MTHNTREVEEVVKNALIQYAQSEKGKWGMCLDFAVKTILKALHHQLQKAREEEREKIEQAHMAGYYSCCNRDASYSEARNYFDALNHSELDQEVSK